MKEGPRGVWMERYHSEEQKRQPGDLERYGFSRSGKHEAHHHRERDARSYVDSILVPPPVWDGHGRLRVRLVRVGQHRGELPEVDGFGRIDLAWIPQHEIDHREQFGCCEPDSREGRYDERANRLP